MIHTCTLEMYRLQINTALFLTFKRFKIHIPMMTKFIKYHTSLLFAQQKISSNQTYQQYEYAVLQNLYRFIFLFLYEFYFIMFYVYLH